jgi:hypothetical protein
MADPTKPTPSKRAPVYMQLAVPVVIRGMAHTSLDTSPGFRPRISMEEEARGIHIEAASKTPGAPSTKLFIPWSNIVAVRYAEG